MTAAASASSFDFATAGRIVFGPGRAAELAAAAAGCGNRPFVCTGADPDRHQDLISALPADTAVFPVAGEPTVDVARAAVAAAAAHRTDVVVAIGGGSAIDLAKAVAALVANGGDPMDYLEVIGHGRQLTRPALPVVAVPTTAGTGSEVTANAVLSSPEHQRKVSLRSRSMLPAVAIVDPLLTLGCPPAVTAASGLDALTQCIEPLVSVMANPFSDALSREGLRRAGSGLRRAYADGDDVAARTDMALCSVLGGLSLANAKLGTVHGFAGVIGGMVDAAHGAVCAALLAPVIRTNVAALRSRAPQSPALSRYAEAAALLTGDPAAGIDDLLGWIQDTVAALRVRPLGDLGLTDDTRDAVVAATRAASSTKGNPIALTDDELAAALALAMQ